MKKFKPAIEQLEKITSMSGLTDTGTSIYIYNLLSPLPTASRIIAQQAPIVRQQYIIMNMQSLGK